MVGVAVAVFLSGAVLLGLEITASRVLAPTFGSSLYVWGSLIGVVLGGLALGYWAGGMLADRRPSAYLLVGALALGAVLVAVSRSSTVGPRTCRPLGSRAAVEPTRRVGDPVRPRERRAGVRGTDRRAALGITLERLGRTAGTLFALSTVGSIFGTFATSFWLVPELGTDQVIAAGATTLVAAALVVAVASRLQVAAVLLTASLVPAIAITVAVAPTGQRPAHGRRGPELVAARPEREKRTPRRLDPARSPRSGRRSSCERRVRPGTTGWWSSTITSPGISASTTRSRARCG